MSNTYTSESAIVEGCKKQEKEAQMQLYQLFCRKMILVSYKYTKSYDDAKDIVHDCFVLIFEKIVLYNGAGSLDGWIRKIVVNKSIDFINKKNKYSSGVTSEELYELKENSYIEDYGEEEDIGDLQKMSIDEKEILSAIDQIKDSYRVVFVLFVVDGLSHKEICQKLNINEELSRIRLSRARGMLKDILLKNNRRKGKNRNS